MSFFSSIGSFFKKVFGNEAAWERIASSTLTVIAPLLGTVLTLTAGAPVAASVEGVITQVQNDLAAVNAVVTGTQTGSSKSTAVNLLNAIKSDLSQLLASADVKNANLNAEATAAINTVISEVTAIAQAAA